ncbi:hypothetical protein WS62_07815 [Burkholderia sp. ABCPW 14]|uniref:hypothetical protein n=1 Tax=Burkholderia sp. ABCPW 14 TaxID=1637860 RepID=UPI000770D9D3|nr:hypothetical protein WS62_07815 [Burkholderia sp. ABCPW 14]
MPSVAQKVFEFVPIQESWTTKQIVTQVKATTKAQIDSRTADNCLARLRDAGLVREVTRGEFRRVRLATCGVTADMGDEAEPESRAPASEAPGKRDSSASPIDLLSGIANRLTATVESIREIAVEIETAALVIEEQQSANGREADKLRQLQALLKTL